MDQQLMDGAVPLLHAGTRELAHAGGEGAGAVGVSPPWLEGVQTCGAVEAAHCTHFNQPDASGPRNAQV